MPQARYNTAGPWFKGNTHIHSTASDGSNSYRELAERYAGAGYDFLFATDHRYPARIESEPDLPLLCFNGIEIDGTDTLGGSYHVVGLGIHEDIGRETPFIEALRLLKSRGIFTILAHPQWWSNNAEESLRHDFDGVEVYNNVTWWANGKGRSDYIWDRMLGANLDVLGFACDDAHITEEYPGWNGGWIVVCAPELTRENILAAIRRGEFYASCGPEIHSIHTCGDALRVRTSPVRMAWLVGPTLGPYAWAADEEGLTEVELGIPADAGRWRLEIEDFQGKRAWTNTLLRPR
jgi:hypothetical protein